MSKEITAEKILRLKFIPNVCSDEYFNHCIERKGEFKSNVTQSLEAMQEYSYQQNAALLERVKDLEAEKFKYEQLYEEYSQEVEDKEVDMKKLESDLTKYKSIAESESVRADGLQEEVDKHKELGLKMFDCLQNWDLYFFEVMADEPINQTSELIEEFKQLNTPTT